MGTPYQKWLDEDVVYIISREERAAYQSLLTDAEREQFIEQFWQRRDPTPGTPENEYKDEHYRRIAYANQNYSATDGRVPGWRTARGRFYIIYGPADEIDDHTNGSPAPYQMWRYRWVEGFGTNVQFRFSIDPTGNSHLTQIVGASPLASFEGAGDGQTIPGGHATIQVYPNGFTAFSIPRKFLTGQVDILGEVRTAEHVGVANFRDVAPAGDAPYTTILILEPGTYRFQVLVRENATGRIYTETMGFEVK
jgi:GWxTD domain-containing protein